MKRYSINDGKEVDIEVFKYEGKKSLLSAPQWIKRALDAMKIFFDKFGNLIIRTSTGLRHIMEGDYILKDDKSSDVYFCRSDVFSKLYATI